MNYQEAEKIFYKATNELHQGNIPAALDLFNDIATHLPDFGKAQHYLGVIYLNYLKDASIAETHFKKAIANVPGFTESYLGYASLLLSQERFAEMNAHLNKVTEIPGVKKEKVFQLFGMMNELQGRLDESIGYYKKAIAATFSDEDMIVFEKAINRCEAKKKYL